MDVGSVGRASEPGHCGIIWGTLTSCCGCSWGRNAAAGDAQGRGTTGNFLPCSIPACEEAAEDELERQSEVYFLVTFAVEIVVKMVTFGIACHRLAYLRSGWNCMDALIVLINSLLVLLLLK